MRTRGLKARSSAMRKRAPGGGRPAAYDKQRMPYMAEVLCREHGFTHEQLAKVFGVSKRTVDFWAFQHEEFKLAVRRGRDAFDSQKVKQVLLRRALGYDYTEKTIKRVFLRGKDRDGVSVLVPGREVTVARKQMPPETAAIKFWLTNRQPDEWKMLVNVSAEVKGGNAPQVSVRADLSKLNAEQLRLLRDLVREHQLIDVTGEASCSMPIEELMARAEDAQLLIPHVGAP